MKKAAFIFVYFNLIFSFSLQSKENDLIFDIVVSAKQIELEEFPGAFNPSLIKIDSGFLMTFRYWLYPLYPSVSFIGIVTLDHELNLTSAPKLLNTRHDDSLIPSQTEDARIFSFNKKIYVLYNDNPEHFNPSLAERRDMFIAEIQSIEGEYVLTDPLKLFHEDKYENVYWQKNWVPFEWNQHLLMGYYLPSHEVLEVDLSTGSCTPVAIQPDRVEWGFGELRGGAPALLIDGEYVSFFHSSMIAKSVYSNNQPMHHYYMGAYVFSGEPPFSIKKMSPRPLCKSGFYTQSSCDKRVIFPGGFAAVKNKFYLAYGKDDLEIWIAIIDKKKLMKSLKRVDQNNHKGKHLAKDGCRFLKMTPRPSE